MYVSMLINGVATQILQWINTLWKYNSDVRDPAALANFYCVIAKHFFAQTTSLKHRFNLVCLRG